VHAQKIDQESFFSSFWILIAIYKDIMEETKLVVNRMGFVSAKAETNQAAARSVKNEAKIFRAGVEKRKPLII